MIKKIILITTPFIVLIGAVLVAFNIANINGATIIEQKTLAYGTWEWNYYYFNTYKYMQNLQNALIGNGIQNIIPSMPPQINMDTASAWFIPNYFGLAINWVLYAINWTVVIPTKVLIYPINLVITLLGINTSDIDYIKVIRAIYTFQIQYVQYA